MSRYTSGQINVFSVIVETLSNNEANVKASGRLFHSFEPADANETGVNGRTGSQTTDSRRDDQIT